MVFFEQFSKCIPGWYLAIGTQLTTQFVLSSFVLWPHNWNWKVFWLICLTLLWGFSHENDWESWGWQYSMFYQVWNSSIANSNDGSYHLLWNYLTTYLLLAKVCTWSNSKVDQNAVKVIVLWQMFSGAPRSSAWSRMRFTLVLEKCYIAKYFSNTYINYMHYSMV